VLISFKTIRHKKFFIAIIKLYQSQLTEQSYFGMVGHNWSIFEHGQIKSLVDAINNLVEAKHLVIVTVYLLLINIAFDKLVYPNKKLIESTKWVSQCS